MTPESREHKVPREHLAQLDDPERPVHSEKMAILARVDLMEIEEMLV